MLKEHLMLVLKEHTTLNNHTATKYSGKLEFKSLTR